MTNDEQAYIIPVDAENRFREVVRGVVFGQVDERLRLAWSVYERVLTHFPVESTIEWAVLDDDVLETWPSRDAAVAELNSFYSDNARLVCRTVTDWVDAGGRA